MLFLQQIPSQPRPYVQTNLAVAAFYNPRGSLGFSDTSPVVVGRLDMGDILLELGRELGYGKLPKASPDDLGMRLAANNPCHWKS